MVDQQKGSSQCSYNKLVCYLEKSDVTNVSEIIVNQYKLVNWDTLAPRSHMSDYRQLFNKIAT